MSRTTRPLSPYGGWVGRAVIGIGLYAGTWYALQSPRVQRADVRVGDALRTVGGRRAAEVVIRTTDLGSIYAVVAVSGTLAAAGRRRAAWDVLATGLVAWNLAQVNKRWVRRERPYDTHGARRLIRRPTGSSYPSGHAAVGTAVMVVLADQARPLGGRLLLRGLGAYVGLSRVYVGVHYPTDVLGGTGLGLVLGSLWRGPVSLVGRAGLQAAWRATQLPVSLPSRHRRRMRHGVGPPVRT